MTASAGAGHPATLAFEPPERIANWRPLVHWLLAIPHFVVLYVLNLVAEVTAVVSWFAILFTGRDLAGLAGLRVMALRYGMRVQVYVVAMVEAYPPFTFETTGADPGDAAPLRIDVAIDEGERNRVTVLFRLLLAIPSAVLLGILAVGAAVCVLIGMVAVLVTGRWPAGPLGFVVRVARWAVRLQAYLYLLTDEYPPFTLD